MSKAHAVAIVTTASGRPMYLDRKGSQYLLKQVRASGRRQTIAMTRDDVINVSNALIDAIEEQDQP